MITHCSVCPVLSCVISDCVAPTDADDYQIQLGIANLARLAALELCAAPRTSARARSLPRTLRPESRGGYDYDAQPRPRGGESRCAWLGLAWGGVGSRRPASLALALCQSISKSLSCVLVSERGAEEQSRLQRGAPPTPRPSLAQSRLNRCMTLRPRRRGAPVPACVRACGVGVAVDCALAATAPVSVSVSRRPRRSVWGTALGHSTHPAPVTTRLD